MDRKKESFRFYYISQLADLLSRFHCAKHTDILYYFLRCPQLFFETTFRILDINQFLNLWNTLYNSVNVLKILNFCINLHNYQRLTKLQQNVELRLATGKL